MAYEELKERQSVMWGNGPYQRVTETLEDIHERVIDTLAPAPGDRWLDLACGTGAIAERAAAGGADVTGLDLSPALIETAKERAAELGLDIEYMVGDAENLPFEDGSYDKVSSTFGIMFAPDHDAVARELARVTATGGRLALANWTRKAASGRCSRSWRRTNLRRHPRARSTGATSPACGSFSVTRSTWRSRNMSRRYGCRPAEDYWELFSTSYGPTKTCGIAGERREELIATGSSSSRRTTRTTGRWLTPGNTC